MTDLIAVLSTGKGTWGHVNALISGGKWDKVYLITNEFGKENFKADSKTELIVVNTNGEVGQIKEEILKSLKDKIKGEVAVNFISGSGKEHMGLMAALIKLGVGFRMFISSIGEGVKEV